MMFRNLRPRLAVAALIAMACTGLTAPAVTAEPSEAETAEAEAFPQLCLRAQVQTAKLRVVKFRRQGGTLSEVPYTDLNAFAASKPQVQPLTVTSYTTPAAGLPKQVRCKGKSADHLTDVYGADIAGPEGDCAHVNRVTLRQVARSLTQEERKALVYRPNKVVIDPDTPALTGQDWLADFPVATKDAGGNLHLPSKSLLVPLDTPGIPDAFKGQHYCTLIAPEYLKALLLGTVQP
ncbi:hypothetical protein [Nocardia sp. XZ_19_385]|uniref:hypothetical protein n=1 Tax=Nocardia sp. XZ_19_385 TaxID=2769488 RepID=UPI00188F169C|nr:hypothetical protein [Nocardia sp. XZ_19_385]